MERLAPYLLLLVGLGAAYLGVGGLVRLRPERPEFWLFGLGVRSRAGAGKVLVVAALLLLIAAFFFGMGSPQIFAIAQTLGGPRAAGQWVGFQNTVGNLAGIAAPIVTGFVIDRTGEYFWAFVLAGAISLIGIFAWGVIIPRVQPVRWPDDADVLSTAKPSPLGG